MINLNFPDVKRHLGDLFGAVAVQPGSESLLPDKTFKRLRPFTAMLVQLNSQIIYSRDAEEYLTLVGSLGLGGNQGWYASDGA